MRYPLIHKDPLKLHARIVRSSDLLRSITLIRLRRQLRIELGAY